MTELGRLAMQLDAMQESVGRLLEALLVIDRTADAARIQKLLTQALGLVQARHATIWPDAASSASSNTATTSAAASAAASSATLGGPGASTDANIAARLQQQQQQQPPPPQEETGEERPPPPVLRRVGSVSWRSVQLDLG